MGLIKGIPVTLYEKTSIGKDAFNNEQFEETPVEIENVLIEPLATGSDSITDDQRLHGRTAQYELSIPKGDTHEWENRKVEFYGQTFQTFGIPKRYIESLTPLRWNLKVKVERYG